MEDLVHDLVIHLDAFMSDAYSKKKKPFVGSECVRIERGDTTLSDVLRFRKPKVQQAIMLSMGHWLTVDYLLKDAFL